MLRAIDTVNQINAYLKKQPTTTLIDFKVILKISMEIEIYLLVYNEGDLKSKIQNQFNSVINQLIIREIPDFLVDDYKHIFKNKKTIDLGLRRRLNNFIDFVNTQDSPIEHPIITTFYSYKGGLGRSTTLASFATFCAKIKKQRVVIIDCDFEAPGFTNYFDLDPEILSQKNGVVEYLLDKQFYNSANEKLDIEADYSYKVGYEYIGQGEIFIIPSGNLSNIPAESKYEVNGNGHEYEIAQTHRDHYLEALSRIDISSVTNIINQFKDFIEDINIQLKPDIILIDSRTGFNDIFAVLASISKVIVGLFGINLQNKIGIEQFLDTFGSIHSKKDIVLVNSIIPDLEYFEKFSEFIDNYIETHEKFFNEEVVSVKNFKKHYIKRDDTLAKVGTDFVYKKFGKDQLYDVNWVNLIEQNIFFQPLFDDIYNAIQNATKLMSSKIEKLEPIVEVNIKSINESSGLELFAYLDDYKDRAPKAELQEKILEKLDKNIPQRYADYKVPEPDDFYFRDCMKDMFNRDKFLIIGSKGTGKTFLYQSFKNSELRTKLQKRSGIDDDKHIFVNLISVKDQKENEGMDRYLEAKDFGIDSIKDTDYFFERFWLIFVWNSIMLNDNIKSSKYFNSDLPIEPITKEPKTVLRFKKYIDDENIYSKIFYILKKLDEQLKQDDKNLIILFDQLDFVVKPENWSKGIAPLLNFWRSNPFKRILPKIFLRSDLFKKLTNLTNIQSLISRSINIEWKKEELFAYFFKIVLKNAKNEFLLLHYAYADYENLDFIKTLSNSIEDNQIPLDEKILQPLVETFFGKNADWKNDSTEFGESYDWFYKNLVDANGNVSIRPFLDLIDKSIDIYFNSTDLKFQKEKRRDAVLSSSYFSSFEAREFAVERYYTDLANEQGNNPLLKVHQFIKKDGPMRYKIPNFWKSDFFEMINEVIKKYRNDDEIKSKSPDDIAKLLLSNGIFKEIERTNKKYINYVMPFLYRNYFGVSNSNLDMKR